MSRRVIRSLEFYVVRGHRVSIKAVLVTHTSVEGRTCLEEIRAGAAGDVELPV